MNILTFIKTLLPQQDSEKLVAGESICLQYHYGVWLRLRPAKASDIIISRNCGCVLISVSFQLWSRTICSQCHWTGLHLWALSYTSWHWCYISLMWPIVLHTTSCRRLSCRRHGRYFTLLMLRCFLPSFRLKICQIILLPARKPTCFATISS